MEKYGVKLGLLEYLSYKAGCMYLSDLHLPKNLWSVRIALRRVSPSLFGVEEWNDAVEYITGRRISFSSSEQAVEYLLSCQEHENTRE